MNADEKEIYEMLKQSPDIYLSICEISNRLGRRRLFEQDRNWARPILRRMEMDGLVESNPFGDYKFREKNGNTTNFFKALELPGVTLGETTIISLDSPEVSGGDEPNHQSAAG